MKDSKREILEILKKDEYPIDELSQKLNISPTAIRQHLMILERDALVRKKKINVGMGRPKYVYSLTEKADLLFPKAYENFLRWIIEEVIHTQGEDRMRDMIRNIARKNARRILEKMDGKTPQEKIDLLLQFSNDLGYYMEYDEAEGMIKVYNCLFSKSAHTFGTLICTYDIEFFGTLLGTKIKKKDSKTRGSKYCSFHVCLT
jgi:predicted ArsR family transcriptional regulator